MDKPTIEKIHDSLLNGQRRQMVEQIDQYGLYEFWEDYNYYLKDTQQSQAYVYNYFTDACISYHRIKNR